MRNKRKPLLIVCLVGVLVLISCQISAGGPIPSRTVSASNQAANELKETLDYAFNNPDPSGLITITLTEPQLTSLLEQQLSQQPQPYLQDSQVFLQNEQVEIFGVIQMSAVKANARFILQVGTDQNGKLTATLISVDLGPLPAPQSLVENISALIDSAMQESISSMTSSIKIENVNITNGLMTISGRRR